MYEKGETSCCCGPSRRKHRQPSDPQETCARFCTGGMIFALVLMFVILALIGKISSDIFFWFLVVLVPLGCCGIWRAGSYFRERNWTFTGIYAIIMIILVIMFMYIVGYADVLFP